MPCDQVREALEGGRRRLLGRFADSKEPNLIVLDLLAIIRRLGPADAGCVHEVIVEWILSADKSTQIDGRMLATSLKVREAVPALRQLAAGLAASDALLDQYEAEGLLSQADSLEASS